jgi:predicted transcriptional regulator
MGFFGSNPANDLLKPRVNMVRLTSDGESKLKNMEASELDSEFRVLSTIKKHQPCEVAEISRELGKSDDMVRHKLYELSERKLVQVT